MLTSLPNAVVVPSATNIIGTFYPDVLRDNVQAISQHYRSNWIAAEEDDEDEDEENEQYIQSTPPYYEEH